MITMVDIEDWGRTAVMSDGSRVSRRVGELVRDWAEGRFGTPLTDEFRSGRAEHLMQEALCFAGVEPLQRVLEAGKKYVERLMREDDDLIDRGFRGIVDDIGRARWVVEKIEEAIQKKQAA